MNKPARGLLHSRTGSNQLVDFLRADAALKFFSFKTCDLRARIRVFAV
jgi:hypothetical protein